MPARTIIDERLVGERRRSQIIAAAERVITSRGVAETRLVDVADSAGVSVGLVQHYFRSRANLLQETFLTATRESVAALEAITDSEPDPLRRLVAFAALSIASSRWPLWLEFWVASFRDETLRQESVALYRGWQAPFLRVIEEGTISGRFRPTGDVQQSSDRVVAMIDGLAIQMLLANPNVDGVAAFELLVGQLRQELQLGHDALSDEATGEIASAYGLSRERDRDGEPPGSAGAAA